MQNFPGLGVIQWNEYRLNNIQMRIAEAQDNLAKTVNLVASSEERVILSQDGKDVAAVISIEEFWLLERLIRGLEDQIDIENAKGILTETKPEDYIPYKQVRKELGL